MLEGSGPGTGTNMLGLGWGSVCMGCAGVNGFGDAGTVCGVKTAGC